MKQQMLKGKKLKSRWASILGPQEKVKKKASSKLEPETKPYKCPYCPERRTIPLLIANHVNRKHPLVFQKEYKYELSARPGHYI